MLEDGKSHDYMQLVQGFSHQNALVCTIPWCTSIFSWLPPLEAMNKLFLFAAKQVAARLPHGQTPTDIFSHLLKEDRMTKRKYTTRELNIECVALVIGGNSILCFISITEKLPSSSESLSVARYQEFHQTRG
jgi:hypothetical protein